MPVYKGSLPKELLKAQKMPGALRPEERPRFIVKQLLESGEIEPLEKMQIVTQVSDLNDPDDGVADGEIPSMLHHFDKSDLDSYALDFVFDQFNL